MSNKEVQDQQTIFTLDNKYVIEGWQNVNPKNKQKLINTQKLQAFLKYVFQNSQEELQMQLQQDTDFMQMIVQFKQQNSLPEKDAFTFQESVQVLNWAVSEDQEEEQQQKQPKVQQNKNKKVQENKKTNSDINKANKPQKSEQKSEQQKSVLKQPAQQKKQLLTQKTLQQKPIKKDLLIQNQQVSTKPAKKSSTNNSQVQQQKQNQKSAKNLQPKTQQNTQRQYIIQAQQKHQKQQTEHRPVEEQEQLQAQNHRQDSLGQQPQQQQQKQQHSHQPNPHNDKVRHQNNNVKVQNNTKPKTKPNTKPQHQRSSSSQSLDWGKQSHHQEEQKHQQLYHQINSYKVVDGNEEMLLKGDNHRDGQKEEGNGDHDHVEECQLTGKHTQGDHKGKCPLSIKKSLAKINAKNKYKSKFANSKSIIPALNLSSEAPQLKYIKKIKLVIKNKKPKAQYHPENNGLKELFKFYCQLNSEVYNVRKHKDPAKGTFDQLDKRSTNLYMHNFMLFCKDFDLIQTRLPSNPSYTNKNKENTEEKLQNKPKETQDQRTTKKRNSKGSVPQSLINQKAMSNAQNQKSKKQVKEKIKLKPKLQYKNDQSPWDRDKLSNYFKKQADYTLNVKYEKFIEIVKTILGDKMQVNTNKEDKHTQTKKVSQKTLKTQQNETNIHSKNKQIQQNEPQQKSQQNQVQQQQQNNNTQINEMQKPQETSQAPTFNINPQIMTLCKLFKIETVENSIETFKKLKVIHKILDPPSFTPREKKAIKPLNGHFESNIEENIKKRLLERQKHQIEVKQKYLSKYSAPELDSYSSFKAATSQTNNLNGLYGSGPKLNPSKNNQDRLISSQGETYMDAGLTYNINLNLKKKHSKENALEVGSIIKDARNEVLRNIGNKTQSKQIKGDKHYRNTQNLENLPQQTLGKSRLAVHHTQNLGKNRPMPSSQSSSLPYLGYKKLGQLRSIQQDQSLSTILLNNSRIQQKGGNPNRQKKIKSKSKDIHSPLLQRMGCHQDDDVLNRYFDQEKGLVIGKGQAVNTLR